MWKEVWTAAARSAAPHPAPRTPHPAPRTLHPAPCTLHPAPCTPHPAPCTLHPAPCTLHPAPYTLHPTPSTLQGYPRQVNKVALKAALCIPPALIYHCVCCSRLSLSLSPSIPRSLPSSSPTNPPTPCLCTGGLDVIQKEAWPFYRTISGVRLCWELEEPKGSKGSPI